MTVIYYSTRESNNNIRLLGSQCLHDLSISIMYCLVSPEYALFATIS